jgi:uncharacterized UBP type Zn finger protein
MPDKTERCEHFAQIQPVKARTNGCEECLAMGASWNELRVCLSCGHVGCCEDSEHAHALQHFNATGHAIIASFERDETWGWCYLDRRYFDPMPGKIPKRRITLGTLVKRLWQPR